MICSASCGGQKQNSAIRLLRRHKQESNLRETQPHRVQNAGQMSGSILEYIVPFLCIVDAVVLTEYLSRNIEKTSGHQGVILRATGVHPIIMDFTVGALCRVRRVPPFRRTGTARPNFAMAARTPRHLQESDFACKIFQYLGPPYGSNGWLHVEQQLASYT
jgi:hypothetical protein